MKKYCRYHIASSAATSKSTEEELRLLSMSTTEGSYSKSAANVYTVIQKPLFVLR